MSHNLCCTLVLPNKPKEDIWLIQTSTSDTDRMLEGSVTTAKPPREPGQRRDKYRTTTVLRTKLHWKETARRYLKWVDDNWGRHSGNYDPDLCKRERRKIGEAWRLCDEQGGYLDFGRN